MGPMVAAFQIIHVRRATKFACHQNHGGVQEILFSQIVQQGRQSGVKCLAPGLLGCVVVGMGIPTRLSYFDASHPGLNQLSGCDTASAKRRVPVLLQSIGRHFGHVKCCHLLGGHHALRHLIDFLSGQQFLLCQSPTQELLLGNLRQHIQSAIKSFLFDPRLNIRHFLAGIVGAKGIILWSQISTTTGKVAGQNRDVAGNIKGPVASLGLMTNHAT